jgi:hypothetical protein
MLPKAKRKMAARRIDRSQRDASPPSASDSTNAARSPKKLNEPPKPVEVVFGQG